MSIYTDRKKVAMRGHKKLSNVLRIGFMVALAAVLGACEADSPTEPRQTVNPPIPTAATTGFAISVGVSPNTVVLGEATTVQVTVVARRTDTNELMAQGSTALLSTTNGLLTNEAGTDFGTTITLTFGLNGTAQATLAGVLETATIRAQIEQSLGQATLTVAPPGEVIPFTLVQVSPNFGPPAGGTEVRIEGTGLSRPVEVIFGGIAVPVLDVTSSVIRVQSPQIELPTGQNRIVGISVSVNVGEEDFASGSIGSAYTYTRNTSPVIPKIISVTPSTGPNEGRTRVTIFGEAFGTEVQVFFGAASLIEASILDLAPTRIVVETPPATGQNAGVRNSVVAVRVRDLRSGFEATLANAFQYGGVALTLTAIQPDEGIYLGGTLVTIFGTGGFEAPVTVNFAAIAEQVVSVSGTEVVVRAVPVDVGCNPPTFAPVSVVNVETGESGSGLGFNYRTITPRVDSVFTNSAVVDIDTGAVIGDPLRTISGAGFDRQSFPPNVDFFSATATERSPSVTITSLDPNPANEGYDIGDEMVVEAPGFRALDTEICFVGENQGTRKIDTRVTVSVTARETGCVGQLAQAFTYIPNDTSCEVGPEAIFQVQERFGGDPFTVNVVDQSQGAPTSWRWNFGDGTPLILNQFPAPHTYAEAGEYTIKLTVSNDQGANSLEQTVTIEGPPVAAFSVEENVGGDPFTVALTDESTGAPTMWNWNFGDGVGSSVEQNPTYVYGLEGTFTITLTASNASGSDMATAMVTITNPPDPPVAGFNLLTNVFANPFAVRFVDQSSGGTPDTFELDFDDGTVISGNGSPPNLQDHTYAAAATYDVKLTLENAGGTDTFTVTQIIPAP